LTGTTTSLHFLSSLWQDHLQPWV